MRLSAAGEETGGTGGGAIVRLRRSAEPVILRVVVAKPVLSSTSEAVDDYLKTILDLSGPGEERVAGVDIARYLGVRGPSVTGMLQKLAAHRPPFVEYAKHRGVRLTASGKRRAGPRPRPAMGLG